MVDMEALPPELLNLELNVNGSVGIPWDLESYLMNNTNFVDGCYAARQYVLEVVILVLAILAVLVNTLLLVVIYSSGKLICAPGFILLTTLEILLNLFLVGSHSLSLVELPPKLLVEDYNKYMAILYALIFFSTVVTVIHGIRNFWMLLLSVIRLLIVVNPFIQRKYKLLTTKYQLILLGLFSVLPLLGMVPIFVPRTILTLQTAKIIRVVKLVFEGIIPGLGMLLAAVLIVYYLKKAESRRALNGSKVPSTNGRSCQQSHNRVESKRDSAKLQDHTATKIVVSLAVGFLVLEWPMNIVQLRYGIAECGVPLKISTATICLISLSSCLNFVVFSFWSIGFRRTLVELSHGRTLKDLRYRPSFGQSMYLSEQQSRRQIKSHPPATCCEMKEILVAEGDDANSTAVLNDDGF